RPIDSNRVSMLTRNEPSSTAATARMGRCVRCPTEIGPLLMTSAVTAHTLLRGQRIAAAGDANARHDRHARTQTREELLPSFELDADGNTLHDLGEVSSRVVR